MRFGMTPAAVPSCVHKTTISSVTTALSLSSLCPDFDGRRHRGAEGGVPPEGERLGHVLVAPPRHTRGRHQRVVQRREEGPRQPPSQLPMGRKGLRLLVVVVVVVVVVVICGDLW